MPRERRCDICKIAVRAACLGKADEMAQQRRDLEQQKLELEDELAKANRRANKAKQMAAAAIGEL